MTFYNCAGDVRCEKCGSHPEFIIWDAHYDYDGNDRIHEYGTYRCACGDFGSFETNDPYQEEED